jgi:hypothetical protein
VDLELALEHSQIAFGALHGKLWAQHLVRHSLACEDLDFAKAAGHLPIRTLVALMLDKLRRADLVRTKLACHHAIVADVQPVRLPFDRTQGIVALIADDNPLLAHGLVSLQLKLQHGFGAVEACYAPGRAVHRMRADLVVEQHLFALTADCTPIGAHGLLVKRQLGPFQLRSAPTALDYDLRAPCVMSGELSNRHTLVASRAFDMPLCAFVALMQLDFLGDHQHATRGARGRALWTVLRSMPQQVGVAHDCAACGTRRCRLRALGSV